MDKRHKRIIEEYGSVEAYTHTIGEQADALWVAAFAAVITWLVCIALIPSDSVPPFRLLFSVGPALVAGWVAYIIKKGD